MNSRQRRKLRRRFRHEVPVSWDHRSGNGRAERVSQMLEWCRQSYGDSGYHYGWKQHQMVFSFQTTVRAMEFKLIWA